jgi:hypothetical protein
LIPSDFGLVAVASIVALIITSVTEFSVWPKH